MQMPSVIIQMYSLVILYAIDLCPLLVRNGTPGLQPRPSKPLSPYSLMCLRAWKPESLTSLLKRTLPVDNPTAYSGTLPAFRSTTN